MAWLRQRHRIRRKRGGVERALTSNRRSRLPEEAASRYQPRTSYLWPAFTVSSGRSSHFRGRRDRGQSSVINQSSVMKLPFLAVLQLVMDHLPAGGIVGAAWAARPDNAHPELLVPRGHSLAVRPHSMIATQPAHIPIADDVPSDRSRFNRHRSSGRGRRKCCDSSEEYRELGRHLDPRCL